MELSERLLVSVVIPCLNGARFVGDTIDSILGQDYPHIECVVADGGSTDGTVEILKGYGNRIRWISEPDQGPGDAANKGWRMSQGAILGWLPVGDRWTVPSAVSQAVSYLDHHPDVDLVYGDCDRIDATGNVVGKTYRHEWDLAYAVEHCDHCIPGPAVFMRRDIVERIGWVDPQLIPLSDYDLWLRIGLVGTIRYMPVVLAQDLACPGHLSQKGDMIAAACVTVVRKIFEHPEFPARLKRRQRVALSNAYLRGARYAYRNGRHYGVALQYVLRSLRLRPGNIGSVSWYGSRLIVEGVFPSVPRR